MKPRWASPVTQTEIDDGDGWAVTDFMNTYCRITKDTVAGRTGQMLVARAWQADNIFGPLYARRSDGRRKHRVGLIGVPRKNGKSAIGSVMALHGLFAGPMGAEVYACAADKDQARIVFNDAKKMIEADPRLSAGAKIFRDAVEVTSTQSVFRVLSSEAFTKEGLSPTMVVYDELHAAPNRELWDVMNLGSGARVDPLVVAITTAGVRTDVSGGDSICYSLYEHGQQVASGEVVDPSFMFAWWEPADPEASHRSPDTWGEANPGFGDLIDPEDFQDKLLRTPESEFRIKRCNQWVQVSDGWFPAGVFENRARPTVVASGDRVVVAVDGSWNGDSTAVVGCTVEPEPHLFVIGLWEKPRDADNRWHVPQADVEQCIRDACKKYDVPEVVFDPYRWQRTMEALQDEGLPVSEFPQSPARMVPACSAFYDAVLTDGMTQDGHAGLERHMRNARVKRDRLGPRIVKEARGSSRVIDLAAASVMGFSRAVFYRETVPAQVDITWV